jgi:antitoxin FitA
MGQLLVREVPDNVIAALKKRAKRHGRSAEAEHRDILQNALKPSHEDFWARADKVREELRATGRKFTDSVVLIRQARDER